MALDLATLQVASLAAMGLVLAAVSWHFLRDGRVLGRPAAGLLLLAGCCAMLWKGPGLLGLSEDEFPWVEAAESAFFFLFAAAVLAWAVRVVATHGRILERRNGELAAAQTELVERQRQLVQAEKLAAVGSLTAGVAHEVNNPLAYILTNEALALKDLERMLADPATADGAKKTLHRMADGMKANLQGVRHIKGIVSALNAMVRRSDDERALVDLGPAVEHACRLAADRAKLRSVSLDLDLPTIPPVEASTQDISQVLLNLVLNGIDASPGNGTVRVSARAGAEHVEFHVEDDGPGIPVDLQAKVFNPFFTTKKEGVGLGLSISQRIAEDHGGSLAFQCPPGRGTEFVLRLPRASAGGPRA